MRANDLYSEGRRLRLVCLPGTLCTGSVFEPLLAAFTLEQADWVSETVDYGTARSATEAALLVKRHCDRFDETLVLIGFSLGGIVAVQAALLLQPRLHALVLIDMNGEADRPENAVTRRAAVTRAGSTSIRTFVTETIWPTHVSASHRDDVALREKIVDMAEACGLDRFGNQVEIAITRPPALDTLPELSLPTLVVCGEEDGITPVALSRAIASALPRGEFRGVADAGHFALVERPAAVAEAIGGWLDATLPVDRVRV